MGFQDEIEAFRSRLRYSLKRFKQRPITNTLALVTTLFVGMGPAVYFYFVSARDQEVLEKKRGENSSYNQQIDALNSVQNSLNNLVKFVDLQKEKLKEAEDLVNSLKSEQEKLKPVVEADRKTVETLLELQYQKTRSEVWKDRSIGFALGFLASIFASFVFGLVRYLLNKRNKAEDAPIAG